MFKRDLYQNSHKTMFIKYDTGMQYLSNTVQQETIKNV